MLVHSKHFAHERGSCRCCWQHPPRPRRRLLPPPPLCAKAVDSMKGPFLTRLSLIQKDPAIPRTKLKAAILPSLPFPLAHSLPSLAAAIPAQVPVAIEMACCGTSSCRAEQGVSWGVAQPCGLPDQQHWYSCDMPTPRGTTKLKEQLASCGQWRAGS